MLAIVDGGRVDYVHGDLLGSAVLVTSDGGEVIVKRMFSPYGESKDVTSTRRVETLFTGQEANEAIGLYEFGARYYDSRMGRFVSADNLVADVGVPRTLNRYSYALNNPVTLTDPTGHCPICVAVVVGAVIGGASAQASGGNFWEGAARGAIVGLITGGAGALAEGASPLVQAAVQSAAGAAAAGVNAMVFGGTWVRRPCLARCLERRLPRWVRLVWSHLGTRQAMRGSGSATSWQRRRPREL